LHLDHNLETRLESESSNKDIAKMEEKSNYSNASLDCENYARYCTFLRKLSDNCESIASKYSFRRAAGLISNHFRTDYLSRKVNTKGLDKHGLLPMFLRADVEMMDGKISIDLIIICDNGLGYSVREARGIYEIFTPQELAERSIKARRRKDEYT